MSSQKVLLSCAGGYGAENLYVNFQRSSWSGSVDFIGCHADPYFLSRSQFSKNYIVPLAREVENYLGAIRKIVAAEKIDLFVPKSCQEVSVVSEQRDTLGCRVYLPMHSEIVLCQDKLSFYKAIKSQNVCAAPTYQVTSLNNIEVILGNLRQIGGKYWVRLKTAGLAGAAGAAAVDDAAQARHWIESFCLNNNVSVSEFTISEYLPGSLFEVLLYFRSGELSVAKVYKNLRYSGANSSGAGSTPEVAVTSNDEQATTAIDEAVKAVHAAAKVASSSPEGVYHLSVKYDAEEQPCVTEVNIGRFPSTCSFFDRTGTVNVSELFFQRALGLPCTNEHSGYYDLVDDPVYMIRSLDKEPTFISQSEMSSRLIQL